MVRQATLPNQVSASPATKLQPSLRVEPQSKRTVVIEDTAADDNDDFVRRVREQTNRTTNTKGVPVIERKNI